MMLAKTMEGRKPLPNPAYAMPAYNYQEPNRMQKPLFAERQFQSAEAVQQNGFMGQSRR